MARALPLVLPLLPTSSAGAAGGTEPPWSHGRHRLSAETLTPPHHHMALHIERDETIRVTTIRPFTLLGADASRIPTGVR